MKEQIRRDREALVAELEAAGCEIIGERKVRCGFHEDHTPSADIRVGTDGVWRFRCYAGGCGVSGDVFDIRARRLGVSRDEAWRAAGEPRAHTGRPRSTRRAKTLAELRRGISGNVTEYRYTDPETREIDLVVWRVEREGERKRFLQARPCEGGWEFGAPQPPLPLYNRLRVRDAERVVVVEGEKCVHALHAVGIAATTSPGGAGSAGRADWSPLAGKSVVLWPDADPPDPQTGKRTGIEHMREVARVLETLSPPPRIHWLDPDLLDLPPKGDAADFIAQRLAGLPEEDQALAVKALLDSAQPIGASAEVRALIEATVSGKRRSVDWPWPDLTRHTRALLPGTVTLLCGEPGATKSFMMLQAAAHWCEMGYRVALFELEEDRDFHLLRALAQRVRRSEITDDAWMAAHAEDVRYLEEREREFLDRLGRCIHTAPEEVLTLRALGDWVEARCAEGARIVIVDPVTAVASNSQRSWEDDLRFVARAKTAARKHGASVVLVTHPRKGRSGTGLDDLAGGAAYQRLVQTVLWLQRDMPAKTQLCATQRGVEEFPINRRIWILKTRNTRSDGWQIGYHFDGGDLRLHERGVIVKDLDDAQRRVHTLTAPRSADGPAGAPGIGEIADGDDGDDDPLPFEGMWR